MEIRSRLKSIWAFLAIKRSAAKFIWWIYKHKWQVYVVLYVIGFITIYYIHRYLNLESYDLKDIAKKLLETDFIKKIPPIIGILLFVLLPAILPVIWKYLIQFALVPYRNSKVLETLYDRCWEIASVGSNWIKSRFDKTLADVDGFRTGVQVAPSETAEICNALYHATDAENVVATCLQSINVLHSHTEKKIYLSTTMQTISYLNKFKFTRYLVTSENFDTLFNTSPQDNVKWFVKAHKDAQANLYYVDLQTFKSLSIQNGISEEHLDILFFDGSVVFSLQTDQSNRNNQVIELPNGKNILFVMDDKEKILGYQKMFETLRSSNNSSFRDIIGTIEKNSWNNAYGM